MTLFSSFPLDPMILKALEKMQFQTATPVQESTILEVLQNQDLIALAETGSGKTAACAIPICQKVDVTRKEVQALIIVPTRELALQYATETQKIGVYKGVKAFAIFGGEAAAMQLSKLKSGVQVLVATPGRLIDFIYSRDIDLSHVETLILDEADEMLSMGFVDDLEFIIQCLVHEHQTLLFSATMPEAIRRIGKKHMKHPKEISHLSEKRTPDSISHHFVYCAHHKRGEVLLDLMKKQEPEQSIVFCHSRHQCEDVCNELKKEIRGVEYLHGGLDQELRSHIMAKFRQGKIRHLVATDVASRGIDVSSITHVYIYQLSDVPEIYLHRAGRTGRRSREGDVVTLVTKRELPNLQEVLKVLPKPPIWIGDPPPKQR
jgi:ATP-dependent RNA helicase DeaD